MGGRGAAFSRGGDLGGGGGFGQAPAEQVRAEPETAEPKPEPAITEQRIRDTVNSLAKAGGWAGLVEVRRALGDISHDEITRVLKEMSRTDPNVHLAPESNRKTLKQEDHDAAVPIGGDDSHVISITAPVDTDARNRVQAAGLGQASDEDLELARLDRATSNAFYDEIRAEQRRRQGK